MKTRLSLSHPILILSYLTFLLIWSLFALLSMDSYYYWDWSRHLALSYYDGSPAIAYIIWGSKFLFGDTLFALSMVGFSTTALTTFFLFKTARLLFDKKISTIVACLWLFSPLVTIDLIKQVTYDNPYLLCWSIVIFFTTRYVLEEKKKDLLFIGIFCGLLLLSKYSGVVLILSLLIYLLQSPLYKTIKEPNFIMAMIFCLCIFSPVLIWNAQHDWISFTYQLSVHQTTAKHSSFLHAIKMLGCTFIPALNFMLLFPFLEPLKYLFNTIYSRLHHLDSSLKTIILFDKSFSKTSQNQSSLTLTPSKKRAFMLYQMINWCFLGFYLLLAFKVNIRPYWLTPFLLTSALIAGFYVQKTQFLYKVNCLLSLYFVVSTVILLNSTWLFNWFTHKPAIYYQLLQDFNRRYPNQPHFIITSGWLEARPFYFLKKKPLIYTLPCGKMENQYQLWSTKIRNDLQLKKIDQALYLDTADHVQCIHQFFKTCHPIPTSPLTVRNKTYKLYAYACKN